MQSAMRMHRVAEEGSGTCACSSTQQLHRLMSLAPVWQHVSAQPHICANMPAGAGFGTSTHKRTRTETSTMHRARRTPGVSSDLPCDLHLQGLRSATASAGAQRTRIVALLSTKCSHEMQARLYVCICAARTWAPLRTAAPAHDKSYA